MYFQIKLNFFLHRSINSSEKFCFYKYYQTNKDFFFRKSQKIKFSPGFNLSNKKKTESTIKIVKRKVGNSHKKKRKNVKTFQNNLCFFVVFFGLIPFSTQDPNKQTKIQTNLLLLPFSNFVLRNIIMVLICFVKVSLR